MKKVLVIRFSSFGDIAQALPVADLIKNEDKANVVHWLTRKDFFFFVQNYSSIEKCWSYSRDSGFIGLVRLAVVLRAQRYTHIYDAHSNIRSHLISWLLRFGRSTHFIRRSKNRLKRFLLFTFGLNLFPQPFKGIWSYILPIEDWLTKMLLPAKSSFSFANDGQKKMEAIGDLNNTIVLAPSATWELKRWPTECWRQLIKLRPQDKFVLVGGSQDFFCAEIAAVAPERVINLSGQLSWIESVQVVNAARAVVSGDTGILHIGDLLERPSVAIIGPTAFGYPSRPTSLVAEVQLKCKPCTKDGRGKCSNTIFKKCLTDITPEMVDQKLQGLGI